MRQPATTPGVAIRDATTDDLDALVTIEQACFDSDRLSRRQFRHMLTRAHSTVLAAAPAGDPATVTGYVIVLFHRGTALARLYSIAVAPAARRAGIATALIDAAENAALQRGCPFLRLEVRDDNTAAIRRYEAHGYYRFGEKSAYYEDGSRALRYEKRLSAMPEVPFRHVPHYEQTTDFTCGPACLMMAMAAFDPDLVMDQALELSLWREATTIFMTSGHGGCSGHGLLLAAWRRGYDGELYYCGPPVPFIDSVRKPAKKAIVEVVHRGFVADLAHTGAQVFENPASLGRIREALDAGALAIVLISSFRFTRSKSPHWVLVAAIDDRYVYLHDPDTDEELYKTGTDTMLVPVPRPDFHQMMNYGNPRIHYTLIIRGRQATAPGETAPDAAP